MKNTWTERQEGSIMCPGNPRWEEFRERLGGAEGCGFRFASTWQEGNFRDDDDDWRCPDSSDFPLAFTVLSHMGFKEAEIHASRQHWREQKFYCDCEILFEDRMKAISVQ
jgi:hypothetical protein